MSTAVPADDRAAVESLIGRPPRGEFEVVVRDRDGAPVVVRNAPFLDDGTPMPTLYYLVGADLVRDTSRLEAAGGVRQAEAEVDAAAIATAHEAYAAERDAMIAPDHDGPRPTGGVGGTRRGVKCLHAHLAYHLAGGSDEVGAWTARRLVSAGVDFDGLVPPAPALSAPTAGGTDPRAARTDGEAGVLVLRIGDREVHLETSTGQRWSLPVGPDALLAETFDDADPPVPAQLTNALGLVHDHFDDVVIESPSVLATPAVLCVGHHASSLARTEIGRHDVQGRVTLRRLDLEDLFRTVVSESVVDRHFNPGLDERHVVTIVPTMCIVLSILRRLGLDRIEVEIDQLESAP